MVAPIIKLAITKYKSRFVTASRVSFPKPDQLKKYSAINAPLNKLACLKTQQRNQRINSIPQSVNVNYSIVRQAFRPCCSDVILTQYVQQLSAHQPLQTSKTSNAEGDCWQN